MAPIYAIISYQESVPREKGNTARNFYMNSAIELNFLTAKHAIISSSLNRVWKVTRVRCSRSKILKLIA